MGNKDNNVSIDVAAGLDWLAEWSLRPQAEIVRHPIPPELRGLHEAPDFSELRSRKGRIE